MKKTIAVILFMLTIPFWAFGETLPPPWLPKVSRLKYEAIDRSTGVRLWKEEYTLSGGVQGGRKFLLINIRGEGHFARNTFADLKMPTRWEVNSYYYLDGSVQPYFSKKIVYNLAGRPIEMVTFYYDRDNRKVYFNDENLLTGKNRRKTVDWYDDLVDRYAYAVLLLSYPFAERREVKLHYISDDPKVYSFVFSYSGQEKVEVPAGTFPCHKLKMRVDLGAFDLMSGLFPSSYYYISNTDPKIFVKYNGLEAGIGSPQVDIKLLEYPEY